MRKGGMEGWRYGWLEGGRVSLGWVEERGVGRGREGKNGRRRERRREGGREEERAERERGRKEERRAERRDGNEAGGREGGRWNGRKGDAGGERESEERERGTGESKGWKGKHRQVKDASLCSETMPERNDEKRGREPGEANTDRKVKPGKKGGGG